MSSNGNANYTHIQAHGIASAFEPGFIYQAATIGRPHRPSVGSSFKVADARVELGGSSGGDLIVLGDALLPGCVITGITMDGEDLTPPDVIVTFGLGEALPGRLGGPHAQVCICADAGGAEQGGR